MTDDETRKPPRRTPRPRLNDEGGGGRDTVAAHRARPSPERDGLPDRARRKAEQVGNVAAGSAAAAARLAVRHVVGLTRRDPESVVSIERCDGGWEVGVEVVEAHRIPDSADILAVYAVRLRSDGELCSYQRIQRYRRGQVDRQDR